MKQQLKALLVLLLSIGFLAACGMMIGDQSKKEETGEVNQKNPGILYH